MINDLEPNILECEVKWALESIPTNKASGGDGIPVELYAEYIMWNTKLVESEAGIKIAGRNIKNLRYADDTTLDVRKQIGAKEPLDKGEKREWKS